MFDQQQETLGGHGRIFGQAGQQHTKFSDGGQYGIQNRPDPLGGGLGIGTTGQRVVFNRQTSQIAPTGGFFGNLSIAGEGLFDQQHSTGLSGLGGGELFHHTATGGLDLVAGHRDLGGAKPGLGMGSGGYLRGFGGVSPVDTSLLKKTGTATLTEEHGLGGETHLDAGPCGGIAWASPGHRCTTATEFSQVS